MGMAMRQMTMQPELRGPPRLLTEMSVADPHGGSRGEARSVNCSSCGASNTADALFCEECGGSFGRECPSCGASLLGPVRNSAANVEPPLGDDGVAKASGRQPALLHAGQHLADRILAEQAAMESRGAQDGERKTITALFTDIKGSVEMMEGLDPEEARAIVDPALQLMMDAVHRYEGYVAQSRGDGIFALFGAPIAQEDHARRALYAALRMQEEIKRYSDRLRIEKGVPLADPRRAEQRRDGCARDP